MVLSTQRLIYWSVRTIDNVIWLVAASLNDRRVFSFLNTSIIRRRFPWQGVIFDYNSNQRCFDPTTMKTKPFLRWAGSKRQLLPTLETYWPGDSVRYVEPFAGSARLF